MEVTEIVIKNWLFHEIGCHEPKTFIGKSYKLLGFGETISFGLISLLG